MSRLTSWATVVVMAVGIGGGGAWGLSASLDHAASSRVSAERLLPTTTPYLVPVRRPEQAGWNPTHASYPATDIFVACGAELVSPVDGIVTEIRRVDLYDPAIDDPSTRGGRSVSVVGFDRVRYYLSHLDDVESSLVVGHRISAGDHLGTVGTTGRSSACHAHFGISPPCQRLEWSIRRGVIWPASYLDAWRDGVQRSPASEVDGWTSEHPDACRDAA